MCMAAFMPGPSNMAVSSETFILICLCNEKVVSSDPN